MELLAIFMIKGIIIGQYDLIRKLYIMSKIHVCNLLSRLIHQIVMTLVLDIITY